MDSDGFLDYAIRPFKFGTSDTNLEVILGRRTLKNISRKFKETLERLFTALVETVRFLYLAAHSPKTLFFPGDKLMDDLWHALVIETMDYKALCERLKPGKFIHHSGVPFSEYSSNFSAEQIHEEQCSWLASYSACFGQISTAAFEHLNLAQSLAKRMNGNLAKVNQLGSQLLELVAQNETRSSFDFTEFLAEVSTHAEAIDKYPSELALFLKKLTSNIGPHRSIPKLENTHLEQIFGASTALAFTYWQHLAASERLAGLPEWQTRHQQLWNEISTNQKICGLATTHLANPAGAGIKGAVVQDGFLLNGKASWVCGFEIFDTILIGFDTGEEIVFAVTSFPANRAEASVVRQPMACLTGTSTVELHLNQFFIAKHEVVSQRPKNSTPPAPRPSKFVTPEIGIAKASIKKVENLIRESGHPKHKLIAGQIGKLVARVSEFDRLRRDNATLDTLIPLRDELNHDAVRLLALALGAKAILPESHIPRIQNELLLLDAVLHSPASLDSKIGSICRGSLG